VRPKPITYEGGKQRKSAYGTGPAKRTALGKDGGWALRRHKGKVKKRTKEMKLFDLFRNTLLKKEICVGGGTLPVIGLS